MMFSKTFARASVGLAFFLAAIGVAHLWAAKRGTASPPVPLLWKVSDADNSLYLLGSFHLLMPQDYPLSADVDAAFADAESVVFELSPEESNSPQLVRAMTQAGMRADGHSLNDDLSPATATRLRRWVGNNTSALGRMGLDGQALQKLEPWYAGLLISLIEMSKLGLDAELGLDRHLEERATAAGKSTMGLERGAEQIAFLDGMASDEQTQFLEEALDASTSATDTMKMHADWRKGDADALWRGMALDFRREYPALYHRVNVVRNDAWLPKLEARLKRPGADDTLVVVGSLHLLGEDGVVEKLRAKGYRVERVCSACASLRRPLAR
jgi:uncharacterized protein